MERRIIIKRGEMRVHLSTLLLTLVDELFSKTKLFFFFQNLTFSFEREKKLSTDADNNITTILNGSWQKVLSSLYFHKTNLRMKKKTF